MTTDWILRENPARVDERAVRMGVSTPTDVDEAVAAAAAAQRVWAEVPVEERCRLLGLAAAALESRLDAAALLVCRETGKPYADCRGEAGFALAWLRWVCAEAPAVLTDRWTRDDAATLLLQHKPFGVLAAITPWNAPVILTMLKVAPGLAAGNALVVKPSPLAPAGVAAVMGDLARELGRLVELPGDLVRVVQGGAAVGEQLVGHPLVRKVCFTGGEATGRAIAARAGDALVPTVLELGGNDPVLLLDDAVLDEASVARLVGAVFSTSGQVCMAAKRIYVTASRHDELVDLWREVAGREVVVGDPQTLGVTMGPVVTREARERVLGLLADARGRGGEVVGVGAPADPAVLARGWFVEPSVVLGLDDGAALVRQEQFGPTVPIVAVPDAEGVEGMLARANAGDLGLGASVWSADLDRAFAVAQRIEAGFTFVNTHNRTGMSLRAPFGGVKRSGWGREYGHEGIAELAQTCVVHAPAAFHPGATPPADARAYPSGA